MDGKSKSRLGCNTGPHLLGSCGYFQGPVLAQLPGFCFSDRTSPQSQPGSSTRRVQKLNSCCADLLTCVSGGSARSVWHSRVAQVPTRERLGCAFCL